MSRSYIPSRAKILIKRIAEVPNIKQRSWPVSFWLERPLSRRGAGSIPAGDNTLVHEALCDRKKKLEFSWARGGGLPKLKSGILDGVYGRKIRSWIIHIHSCILNNLPAGLRIPDILVQIQLRIRGSMPLTNGSEFGSGSCYFRHWPSRRQQKLFFFSSSFWRYIHIICQI